MRLPFTVEEFFKVFREYNHAVFPLQVVFYLLALAVIFLSVKKTGSADRMINAVLAFFWLWMGIVYHLLYFACINKAAYFFGGLFILQGLLFFYQGVLRNNLSYRFCFERFGWAGAVLMMSALIIYPLLGYASGQYYPASPTLGLPCPTTIFTFAVLLWSDGKMPFSIAIIPFIWSIIGFFAALQLGVAEDTGLLVAGIAGMLIINRRNRQMPDAAI